MLTAYHLVHYRSCKVPNQTQTKSDLEQLCRAALAQNDKAGNALWSRVNDRRLQVGGPAEKEILLNKVADLSSSVFGEMCLIESKGLQALLALNASTVSLSDLTMAEIYELQERAAPKGSQFIRGMAYWLTIDNHLFFVKTGSMTGEQIQSYLDWLVKHDPSGLKSPDSLEFQAEFDKSQFKGDIGDIRSLRVKGKSAPQFSVNTVGDDTAKTVSTTRRIADKFLEFGQAVPVVEALFGKAKTQSLIESLGPKEYLAVDASVKVKGRRTEESKAQLRNIASGLDDLTEGDVRIEGSDGQLSDGDAILRTKMPFSLQHEGANLLEFNNVADQLQVVYSRFVHDGKILP